MLYLFARLLAVGDVGDVGDMDLVDRVAREDGWCQVRGARTSTVQYRGYCPASQG